jgi:hypothetical protein
MGGQIGCSEKTGESFLMNGLDGPPALKLERSGKQDFRCGNPGWQSSLVEESGLLFGVFTLEENNKMSKL